MNKCKFSCKHLTVKAGDYYCKKYKKIVTSRFENEHLVPRKIEECKNDIV